MKRIQAHLTEKQFKFIEKRVKGGEYETAAAAIRDAVNHLMRDPNSARGAV